MGNEAAKEESNLELVGSSSTLGPYTHVPVLATDVAAAELAPNASSGSNIISNTNSSSSSSSNNGNSTSSSSPDLLENADNGDYANEGGSDDNSENGEERMLNKQRRKDERKRKRAEQRAVEESLYGPRKLTRVCYKYGEAKEKLDHAMESIYSDYDRVQERFKTEENEQTFWYSHVYHDAVRKEIPSWAEYARRFGIPVSVLKRQYRK